MKKLKILFVCILLTNIAVSQETNNLLDSLVIKLEVYNQYHPEQHVYLQTDRDIYSPGDIIWFNILISDNGDFNVDNLDNNINVNLHDDEGNLIIGDFYYVNSMTVIGDFKLPDDQKRGLYYISAVLPSEDNVNDVFTKKIFIDGFYNSDVLLNLPGQDNIIDASSDIEIPVQIIDYQGNPSERFNLNYECFIGNESFKEDNIRSDRSGNVTIQFKAPEETGEKPLYIKFSDNKNTWEKTLILKTTKDQIDLAFYPEGGSLISGINQNIGFIAKDIWGNYIPISGNIMDNQGNLITMSSTIINGFGFFAMNMNPGKNYQFVITSEYGKGQIFDIPAAKENGLALSVPRIDNQFIYTNFVSTLGSPQNLILTVTKGNSLEWATQFQMEDAGLIRIPIEDIADGISLISVLDNNYNKIASRIIYFDNTPNLTFNLNPVVTQDNRINLSVLAMDENNNPEAANVIISISNNLYQHDNKTSLNEFFKLNSYLEFPISNVQTFAKTNTNALNYILIANKLKDFSWEKVINFDAINYDPLNPESGLSGIVTDKKGSPYPFAKVSAFDNDEMQLYSETADEKGYFLFKNLSSSKISDYEINATDENGRSELIINMEHTFFDDLAAQIQQTTLKNTNFGISNNDKLSFVKDNSQIITNPPQNISSDNNPEEQVKSYIKMLQSGKSILEAIRTLKNFNLDGNRIMFPGSINSLNAQGGALIVYDGIKMGEDASVLNNFNPYDIAEINIYTNASDILRFTGLNNVGVIEIISKNGYMDPGMGAEGTSDILLYENGFRVPRDFLSPESLLSLDNNTRSTVYWNPWLNLPLQIGTTFTVTLSELKSDYTIMIEGISEDGKKTGSQVMKVNAK